ncbi:hypothetical protein, partial [Streptomyces sp. SID13726]|uniref:hypothetical protein n=1 Tax=Streptomyces sp. SID13726 TaxID=2706058 RepID=UPI0013BC5B7E
MTTPRPSGSGDTRDGTSRLGSAVVGVVVGLVIFACVGVVGYFLFVGVAMERWADSYNPSDPEVTVTAEDTTAVGQETGLDASNEAYRQRAGTPEDDAEAALAVPAVQAALDPVADGSAVTVWVELEAEPSRHGGQPTGQHA